MGGTNNALIFLHVFHLHVIPTYSMYIKFIMNTVHYQHKLYELELTLLLF